MYLVHSTMYSYLVLCTSYDVHSTLYQGAPWLYIAPWLYRTIKGRATTCTMYKVCTTHSTSMYEHGVARGTAIVSTSYLCTSASAASAPQLTCSLESHTRRVFGGRASTYIVCISHDYSVLFHTSCCLWQQRFVHVVYDVPCRASSTIMCDHVCVDYMSVQGRESYRYRAIELIELQYKYTLYLYYNYSYVQRTQYSRHTESFRTRTVRGCTAFFFLF